MHIYAKTRCNWSFKKLFADSVVELIILFFRTVKTSKLKETFTDFEIIL